MCDDGAGAFDGPIDWRGFDVVDRLELADARDEVLVEGVGVSAQDGSGEVSGAGGGSDERGFRVLGEGCSDGGQFRGG